jgi:hypothetical protein
VIRHPLIAAIWAADLVGLLLLAAAAGSAFKVAVGWSPSSAERFQIELEIKAETAALKTRLATICFAFAAGLLILGIAVVFPDIIPGAMCGTGVLQALEKSGRNALILQALLLALLFFWNSLEALNRSRPDNPLAVASARLQLLALPVALMAVQQTVAALFNLDTQRPVDCCAVVYDEFRSAAEAWSVGGIPDRKWVTAWALLSALVLLLAWRLHRTSSETAVRRSAASAVATLLWLPVAATTLVDILSAYHYGVLQHQCPWCLFLPQHRLVGFPLFGSMAVVVYEGTVGYFISKMVSSFPALVPALQSRLRTAALRTSWAMGVFLLFSALPPLVWRWRFGVWIGG